MLRTIFVFGLLIIGSFYALQSAFYGLLLYLWVAYFRPESWVNYPDQITKLQLSLVIGVYLLIRAPLSDAKFKLNLRSLLLFLILFWAFVSTWQSSYVKLSSIFFEDFVKA